MRTFTFLFAVTFLASILPNKGPAAEPAAAGHHDHGSARGVQSLDVYASGQSLHLFTAETAESDAPSLFHRRSEDGGQTWSAPVRVDAGLPAAHSPHRGNDPQIAATGDRVVAVWMTKGTGYFDSGPMVTALSLDGGQTWQPGPNPADDQSIGGHGFIDIAADSAGVFHLTWLDSRDGKQVLRYASSPDGGKGWSKNQTLKAATCECCSNALATGPDGTVGILFRDGDPRDMTLALSADGGARWQDLSRVGEFGWKFNGCPHVGGGLAFGQTSLHAVVWSGQAERAGLYALASADRGRTWSKPHRLGSPSASHPDTASDGDRRVVAVWDDRVGEKAGIWYSTSQDHGVTWSDAAQLSKSGSTPTHPRVLKTTTGVRAFWTETAHGAPSVWQSAPIP